MAYSAFARFYDRLQNEVDYMAIAKLLDGFIREYGSYQEICVDLACGTGRLTRELAGLGYEMLGVDSSEEMLMEARNAGQENITYLCQDMRELELWGAADAVVCILDSLNHLSGSDDLARTIERVSMFVCDGGLFIFDLNTLYKHRDVLGDNCFCFEDEGMMCVWRNSLNEDMSVDIRLDFFEETGGTYRRSFEEFSEVVFEPEFVKKCLEDNDFEIIMTCDGFSREPVNAESQRVLYICRRLGRL